MLGSRPMPLGCHCVRTRRCQFGARSDNVKFRDVARTKLRLHELQRLFAKGDVLRIHLELSVQIADCEVVCRNVSLYRELHRVQERLRLFTFRSTRLDRVRYPSEEIRFVTRSRLSAPEGLSRYVNTVLRESRGG